MSIVLCCPFSSFRCCCSLDSLTTSPHSLFVGGIECADMLLAKLNYIYQRNREEEEIESNPKHLIAFKPLRFGTMHADKLSCSRRIAKIPHESDKSSETGDMKFKLSFSSFSLFQVLLHCVAVWKLISSIWDGMSRQTSFSHLNAPMALSFVLFCSLQSQTLNHFIWSNLRLLNDDNF